MRGELRVIVLPVEFTDVAHEVQVGQLAISAAGLESYYSTASFGELTLHVALYPTWISLLHPMGYYGNDSRVGDDSAGNPNGSEKLVEDAVTQARRTLDLRNYTNLIVVHSGEDQATESPNTKSSLIWSRTWVGKTFLPNGTDTASIVSEASPVGIWAHEFGHNMGHLPDMYNLLDPRLHYDGSWSLMDLGPYLGTPAGTQPALLDAWSRISLGWITPSIVRNGDFNLIPAEVAPSAAKLGCCYALEVPVDANSYYLAELRLKEGLDAAQRSAGVIIYLFNSSQLLKPQVVDIHHSTPYVGDLSDAALSPGDTFVDVKHQISIAVVSGSPAYYSLHIVSKIPYTLSLNVPQVVGVLSNQTFSVTVNPPFPGLDLRVFVDASTKPFQSLRTVSNARYNFSLFLQPSEEGEHNLTARLSDARGNLLASSSASFNAEVPIWVSLQQPTALYAYLVLGIIAVAGVVFIVLRRGPRPIAAS